MKSHASAMKAFFDKFIFLPKHVISENSIMSTTTAQVADFFTEKKIRTDCFMHVKIFEGAWLACQLNGSNGDLM